MKKDIGEAFKASIPVMMGYVVLGMAFGMLLESKGYHVMYALLMSVFIYAGSMQFVAIELLTTGASFMSAIIMTLLINARHIVYGLSMIKSFEDMGKLKPYMIFSLTDETYSLLVSSKVKEGCHRKYYMFFISLFDQCYWVIGTLLGSFIGTMLTINTTGLDFAMTALFVVIVLEQFLTSEKHIYTYMGFGISILCLLLFGSQAFIIPSMIGIIIGLFVFIKKEEKFMNEILLIGIIALLTFFTRLIPFVLFKNHTNPFVEYLGDVLPYAIMAMLVVYCLKGVELLSGNHGICEIIGVGSVIFTFDQKKYTFVNLWWNIDLYVMCTSLVCWQLMIISCFFAFIGFIWYNRDV